VTAAVRYALLGDLVTVCTAPVLHGGRFLGVIEMVDPLDGSYDPHDVNALAYIAEQFAEFLSQRGVMLDPERIKPPQV
jgi:signal transduction protein with GAF and PtsI domain